MGVNATSEEGFGARQSALGGAVIGFPGDPGVAASFPAALNDFSHFAGVLTHSERFQEGVYDNFALAIPFAADATLGIGFARYGVNDIPRIEDISSIPVGDMAPSTFNAADYLAVIAFARRFGSLDAGANLHFLHRRLDQDGMGIRGDLAFRYRFLQRYMAGLLIKGALPSSARWESGWEEYQSPDAYIGFGAAMPAKYFYGELRAGWESEGLFQKQAQSASELEGSRVVSSKAWEPLLNGNLGLEYRFEFGLSLRAGLSELQPDRWASSHTLGVGYTWLDWLGIDYSYAAHPDLGGSYRVALSYTPAIAHFRGKHFRPGSAQSQSARSAKDSSSGREGRDGASGKSQVEERENEVLETEIPDDLGESLMEEDPEDEVLEEEEILEN